MSKLLELSGYKPSASALELSLLKQYLPPINLTAINNHCTFSTIYKQMRRKLFQLSLSQKLRQNHVKSSTHITF